MSSELLTTAEAAAYVKAKSVAAFDQFSRRHGIPCERYGRHKRYRAAVLDRVLRTMALRRSA